VIHFEREGLVVNPGDLGRVVGKADVDPDTRLKVRFEANSWLLNIKPEEIRPAVLPAGYVVGDRVELVREVALEDSAPLAPGDCGTISGPSAVLRSRRLLVQLDGGAKLNVLPRDIRRIQTE